MTHRIKHYTNNETTCLSVCLHTCLSACLIILSPSDQSTLYLPAWNVVCRFITRGYLDLQVWCRLSGSNHPNKSQIGTCFVSLTDLVRRGVVRCVSMELVLSCTLIETCFLVSGEMPLFKTGLDSVYGAGMMIQLRWEKDSLELPECAEVSGWYCCTQKMGICAVLVCHIAHMGILENGRHNMLSQVGTHKLQLLFSRRLETCFGLFGMSFQTITNHLLWCLLTDWITPVIYISACCTVCILVCDY